MSRPRLAIIGAGPAGLTLGVLLHKRGVPFEIFELRPRPTESDLAKPSGSLDLHDESGLAAIKECGLFEKFLPLTRDCSEETKIASSAGDILLHEEDEHEQDTKGFRPEISRHELTRLLLSQLPAESVKWQHKLHSAAKVTSGGHTQTELDFGPQGKQKFDLVVGADGAWSIVRALLTDVKPRYTGIQNTTVTVRNITKSHPHLAEYLGTGTLTALGNRNGIWSHRATQDSARLYLFISTTDEHFATTIGLAGVTAADAKHIYLSDKAYYAQWSPQLQELITVACDAEVVDNPGSTADIRPLYALPVGCTWDHNPAATVVGDAAHLMCPWAGEGVNQAMWDSLDLSRAIIKAYESSAQNSQAFQYTIAPLLEDFESRMITRSKEKAEETVRNGEIMFGENGAEDFLEMMQSYRGPPPDTE